MDSAAPVDTTLCPLCGAPNRCVMAAGADASVRCWCTDATIALRCRTAQRGGGAVGMKARRGSAALAAMLALMALAGCSSELLYASGRNAQKLECNKLPDSAERERCMKDAAGSYDSYQREADRARTKPQ
jgi:hypothetical protein